MVDLTWLQGLAMACYAAIYVYGLATGDDRISGLGLAAVSGHYGLVALARFQSTGETAMWVGGVLAVFPFAAGWKRFTGQWPRRERRAMAELFGERTLWQMLLKDERLEKWRAKR
jgi:hypothetical protein